MDPTKRMTRQTARLAEKAQPLNAFGIAGPGRGNRVPGKAPTIKSGSQEYWIGRLARDRPDVLAGMKQGKFESVKSAIIAAGWLKQPTVVNRVQKQWEKATEEERQAIAIEVMGWLLWQGDAVYGTILGKAEKLSEE